MLSAQKRETEEDAPKNSQLEQSYVDTVIVFGEGPIKPVLLENELTPEQKTAWLSYKKDPLNTPELSFWLMHRSEYLAKLHEADARKDLSREEIVFEKEKVRHEWQQTGLFAMKQWGRQNALAAGFALYKGFAKQVILTGGKTISKEARERISAERLNAWPSEASLMADIIRSTYGELYQKKYKKSIDESLFIEDASTNTLENFAFSINKYPELLNNDVCLGFLTAGHHLDRVVMLGNLFCLKGESLCAKEILETMKQDKELSGFEAREDIKNSTEDLDPTQNITQEKHWRKGLEDPEYISYWLGYVAMVEHPFVINNIMQKFKDPQWGTFGEKIFAQVGLTLSDYQEIDLVQLAETDIVAYDEFTGKLQELRKPDYRLKPPIAVQYYE